MSVLPMFYVTETSFVVADAQLFMNRAAGNPEHEALMAWLRGHGIEPQSMPAEGRIMRDVDAKTITYVQVARTEGGGYIAGDTHHRTVVLQLDEPPAPWPEIILEHANDNWLAQHDHQNKAQAIADASRNFQHSLPGAMRAYQQLAWEEGHTAGLNNAQLGEDGEYTGNPYDEVSS